SLPMIFFAMDKAATMKVQKITVSELPEKVPFYCSISGRFPKKTESAWLVSFIPADSEKNKFISYNSKGQVQDKFLISEADDPRLTKDSYLAIVKMHYNFIQFKWVMCNEIRKK